MARLLRALTLLVSVLSASAFAPSGWSGRPRTAPLKNGYLDELAGVKPAQNAFQEEIPVATPASAAPPVDYLSYMRSRSAEAMPAASSRQTRTGDAPISTATSPLEAAGIAPY